MARVLSQSAMAKELGVSAVQVHRLVALGMPLELEAARAWRAARSAKTAKQRGEGLEEQRRRKTAAEADMAEMAAAKMREELVAVADVEAAWAAVCDRMRAVLMAVPGRYAPRLRLPMAEGTAVLEDVVGAVLDELAGRDAG